MTATQLLDRFFLDMRCGILELASGLDRLERAEGAAEIAKNERMLKLQQAAALLIDGKPDRAQRVQMLFSDAYDPAWPEKMSLAIQARK